MRAPRANSLHVQNSFLRVRQGEPQAQLQSSASLGLKSPQLVASVASPNIGHSGLAGLLGLVDRAKEKRERITHKIRAKTQQTVASEGRAS